MGKKKKKISVLAIAAVSCAGFGVLGASGGAGPSAVVGFLFIGLILAIAGIFHIVLSKGTRTGLILCLIAVCLVLSPFFFPETLIGHYARPIDYQQVCASNLSGLGKAILVYANDYGNKPPVAGRWCDLLISYADVSPGQFVCQASDCIKGESSYAMNQHVADMNMTELPPDVVLLFETDAGIQYRHKRNWFGLGARKGQCEITEVNNTPVLVRGAGLDKERWNQVGGPEMLSTGHHEGQGCNVLFINNCVEFIKKEDFSKLRWKP